MKKLKLWLDSLALQHEPDFSECLDWLGQYIPWLYQFEQTEQDAIWHAEGNVAIHTNMVLSELYLILNDEAQHIVGAKRQALVLAALLHDIAKPVTTKTKEIDGKIRIVSPKHEEKGASYLAIKLLEMPLDYEVIRMVIGLVGYHQMPKLLVVRDLAYGDYLKLALDADLELLYWLELADMRGRHCEDLPSQIDYLEQFRMFAEDYQLWQVSNAFESAVSQIQVKDNIEAQRYLDGYAVNQLIHGSVVMAEESVAKTYQAASDYGHLYVTCGVSGSGKSSWIAKNLPDFEVISLDDIRAELNGKRESQKNRGQVLQLAKSRLKTALANKRNVVWDATNIRKDFRKIICDFGQNYGALITLVVFQIQESTLRMNNTNRNHMVADDVISAQITKLEWPSFSEGHRMIIVGEKGECLDKVGKF